MGISWRVMPSRYAPEQLPSDLEYFRWPDMVRYHHGKSDISRAVQQTPDGDRCSPSPIRHRLFKNYQGTFSISQRHMLFPSTSSRPPVIKLAHPPAGKLRQPVGSRTRAADGLAMRVFFIFKMRIELFWLLEPYPCLCTPTGNIKVPQYYIHIAAPVWGPS